MLLDGTERILFAFDIGYEVDLGAAEKRLSATIDRRAFRRGTRGLGASSRTAWPLRFPFDEESGDGKTGAGGAGGEWYEAALFEFGGLCLCYGSAFRGTLDELAERSVLLQEDPHRLARARQQAQAIVAALGDAVREPLVSEIVEDYVVYHVPRLDAPVETLWGAERAAVGRALRAERLPLSDEEIENAVSNRISYGREDACLIDWFGALLAGEGMEDELRAIELATVELVELRSLDAFLDGRIHAANELLARTRGPWSRFELRSKELARLARVQADSALLHQGLDNAVKLVGDDYLARLYRRCSDRFHFEAWDATIERKLSSLDSIYSRLADLAATRRAELLEWVIIVLILLEIVFAFL